MRAGNSVCVNTIQRFAQGPWVFVVIALGQVLTLIASRSLWPLKTGLIAACVIGVTIRLRTRRGRNPPTD